jgi:Tfp pilus assembly protein PilF
MLAFAWLFVMLVVSPGLTGAQETGARVGKARGAVAGEAPIKVGVADKDQAGELPDLTMAIGKRAAVAFAKGDWVLARKLYDEILAVEPENPLALANMGAVTFQLGEHEAAQGYLEKAVGQNPKLVQARVTLGMAYFYTEDLYLAISHLTRAVHDEPGNARAHMYLAVVSQQAGWSRAAEEELRKAIAADPKYAEAHYNLALVYIEQSPPAVELARRHYYQALELGAAPDEKMAAQVK